MELKFYLWILLKKWWIVIPTALVTLTAGIVFTYTRTPVYSATSTYVVVPGPSFGDVKNFASGLDMLGRRQEIATTFSEIAMSRRVKKLAFESLNLAPATPGYSISSKLRAGTNIIEVTVEGTDPTVVKDLTNAIGGTIEQYVQGLYEVFVLIPLDEAVMPTSATSPNKSLNIALAAVLGLVLGGGLAFLSEYLARTTPLATGLNIIDDQTGTYSKEYFLRRLSEEMVRAKRNLYPLSLALMRIDDLSRLNGGDSTRVRTELLRQVAILTVQYLREEDIVAYLQDNIFALLLPDMTGENAKALMEYLQTRVAWTTFDVNTDGSKLNIRGIVGITTYNHNGTSRDELVAQANRALQLAEVDADGKAYLITQKSSNS